MPASQLKRLKASLRESGVTGPQKSKRQKRNDAKDGRSKERAVSRASALESIRENFNPFEVKKSSRGPKHEFATAGKLKASVLGRPGVTKGLGEELRRKSLLVEMQKRNKIGGIVDRRFGENDPTMTPEERAHQRYVREKQSGNRKSGLFDLEGDDDFENGESLTHLGQPLIYSKGSPADDYLDSDEGLSDEDTEDQAARRASKRRRLLEDISKLGEQDGIDDAQKRPKTKQEVMKEVIAKSKLHKYERQQAKEDDEDLREELDANLKDVFALMNGKTLPMGKPKDQMNPERAALIQGKTREQADKEYDQQLRAMTHEARGRPSSRVKTEEEIAEEEAQKLKDLEQSRLRRMRGEDGSGEDEGDRDSTSGVAHTGFDDIDTDGDEFGLGSGISRRPPRLDLDVEDEDDFELDHDLIASGSEIELSTSEEDSSEHSDDSEDEFKAQPNSTDDEADFVKDLITEADAGRADLTGQVSSTDGSNRTGDIAFTFPCPGTHEEFLGITKDNCSMDLIAIIQRIRALYSPKLDGQNRAKLKGFAAILVDHLVYLTNRKKPAEFKVLEQIIRHIHSLAKGYPIAVAEACRKHLFTIIEHRPHSLTAGDLILFTTIGETFSTSDHFHQVVTPAMLCMACYLGQSKPQTLGDLAKGAFVCTQFLQYQRLSKRYIPEVVSYTMAALEALAPVASKRPLGDTPRRELNPDFRVLSQTSEPARRPNFWDVDFSSSAKSQDGSILKQALLKAFNSLTSNMSELWLQLSAYIEIFTPLHNVLEHLISKKCIVYLSPDLAQDITSTKAKISRLLAQARISRRPLALHNHRPLPIKTAIPRFDEHFNPDRKSHDPDRERAEAAKLRAEHRKERKGALRELRKDASFVAREQLRSKRETDAEYERKYRRLVAEIQGEEGREANAYEREKRWRKGKK